MRENVIRELTDVEHVRHAPGMYIGDAALGLHSKWVLEDGKSVKRDLRFVPGVLKLFDEIISNSIDEAFRTGFKGSKPSKFTIDINVSVGDGIQVSDNGRGIPLTEAPGRPGMTQAEVALTKLRAGTNFKEKGSTEHVSIGTHGLGATLVNILSKDFKARVIHGDQVLHLVCSRGDLLKRSLAKSSTKCTGTDIWFMPDWEVFGLTELDQVTHDLIQKRVYDLAACLHQIEFTFNGAKVESKDFKTYLGTFGQHFEMFEGKEFRLGILPSDEAEQVSFVNGIDTYEGGTHVDFVRERIVNLLTERLRKKYKELKPQDVRNKLMFVLTTNSIPGLKFRSQTKEYMTKPATEFAWVFEDLPFEKIVKRIEANPELCDPIVETYKLKMQVKDLVDLKRKKRLLQKVKVPSYIPAAGDDRLACTLFVTEGQSAIGSLAMVRDPLIHGGFPLTGKTLNVHGRKLTEVVANKVYKNLMAVVGLRPGEPVDIHELRYGTIALMADADHDGTSIVGLLINFFSLWPELFHQGRIVIFRSPILKVEKGKQKRIFYDLAEYAEVASTLKDWNVTYLKGLGALNKTEYAEMIQNPVAEVVTFDPDWQKTLDLVFGDSADDRKVWMMEP